MLLDRLQRPVRGVRIVRRDGDSPYRIQIVPLRRLERREVQQIQAQLRNEPGPIVTTALSPMDQAPFRDSGFTELERLYLLRHSLERLPTPGGVANIRSGRRGDLGAVLEIDRHCFDDFWALDKEGLQAARRATPVHRYAVATIDKKVVGYIITGRAGHTSFLQRLGVAPDHRKKGIATQLIVDAMIWAQRQLATSMLVNTQEINERARLVYERLGFELDEDRLVVLEWNR